jgi:hypothetical protein
MKRLGLHPDMGARHLVAPLQNGTLNSISQILTVRFRRDRCHSKRTAKAQIVTVGFFEFFIIWILGSEKPPFWRCATRWRAPIGVGDTVPYRTYHGLQWEGVHQYVRSLRFLPSNPPTVAAPHELIVQDALQWLIYMYTLGGHVYRCRRQRGAYTIYSVYSVYTYTHCKAILMYAAV